MGAEGAHGRALGALVVSCKVNRRRKLKHMEMNLGALSSWCLIKTAAPVFLFCILTNAWEEQLGG